MTCMRRAALLLGSILALATLATAVARADGGAPVRIRDVRVGEHAGFERLVIELDADTEIVWEYGPEPGEESFYIAAAPAQKSRVIVTQLPQIGTIAVTEMKGGTHVSVEPHARRVRAYTLSNPPRLVVDFAPPAHGAFEAPAGARALEPASTLGPLVLEPEPTVEPEPAVEPAPTPEPALTVEPSPTPEPAATVEPPPTPEPEVTPEPAATPEPEITPEPEVTVEPTPTPEPAPTPERAPTPVAKPAEPAPASGIGDGAFPYAYGLALAALLGLAMLAAAAVAFARRRSERSESSVFPVDDDDLLPATRVDEISPAEILAAGDQEAMLEKRLDEEVRARLELEQRFASANEELKVLRDRLHRLERRREGAS